MVLTVLLFLKLESAVTNGALDKIEIALIILSAGSKLISVDISF